MPHTRTVPGANPAETFRVGTAFPFRPSTFAPGVNIGDFGPGENLIGSQITAGANAIPLADLIGQHAEALTGPDRGELAAQTFNLIRERTEPAFQRDLQNVGRRAAALGRIGSGVTTSELGDVQLARERELTQAQTGLALNAAGQTLQDRLGSLSGLLGASGQLFGQGAALRGELRGERGFQVGLEQQAFQNLLAQSQLQDALTSSGFGREMALLQLLQGGFAPAGGGASAQALAASLGAQAGSLGNTIGGLGAALPFLLNPGFSGGGGVGTGVQAPIVHAA